MNKPTRKFCTELLERARHYGWLGDYTEVVYFVKYIHHCAGIALTDKDVEPYEVRDDTV